MHRHQLERRLPLEHTIQVLEAKPGDTVLGYEDLRRRCFLLDSLDLIRCTSRTNKGGRGIRRYPVGMGYDDAVKTSSACERGTRRRGAAVVAAGTNLGATNQLMCVIERTRNVHGGGRRPRLHIVRDMSWLNIQPNNSPPARLVSKPS